MWGDCNPTEPKNRRRRCSLLITGTTEGEKGKTTIIIDTGCDLREQLLDANVTNIDAVFYTHEHADHTHGIDDLRTLALNSGKRINVYFGERAGERLKQSFGYCFEAPKDSGYPPILNAGLLKAGKAITIEGAGGEITLLPVLQQHGNITTFGFRIKNFMYSCDVSNIDEQNILALAGLDMWVVDALRHKPHPSHFCLSQSLEWIERLNPKQAILTNLHVDMDYKTTEDKTPANVSVAFDSMKIDVLNGNVLK